MAQTVSATLERNDPKAIMAKFVTSLAQRDTNKLMACFDTNVQFRALVPSGFRERNGSQQAVALLQDWFQEAQRLELVQNHVHTVSHRTFISYLFREYYSDSESEIIEQHAFCDITNGVIQSMDVLCSGHLTESGIATSSGEYHKFDAGDIGCGSGLPEEFRHQIESIPVGHLLEVTTGDPSAKEDLPSLARLLGHEVISVKSSDKGKTIVIVKRSSSSGSQTKGDQKE